MSNEQKARELLAAEYEAAECPLAAAIIRDKKENELNAAALRAIAKALAQQVPADAGLVPDMFRLTTR